MTQLVITLKDQSYLPNIRRIVKSLQGVEKVNVSRENSQKPRRTARKSLKSSHFLEGLTAPKETTAEQLISDYLQEKYGE